LLAALSAEDITECMISSPLAAADPAARGAPGPRRKVSWRTAAGKLLQAERDLNRSQREAIAKAITRTFTLWQARRPPSWPPACWAHALGGRRGRQLARSVGAETREPARWSCDARESRHMATQACWCRRLTAWGRRRRAIQRRGRACLQRGPRQSGGGRLRACRPALAQPCHRPGGADARARPAQGPPGTGKTKTLLALLHVLAAADGARRAEHAGPILACGDTNAATDNLVEGLLQRGVRVIRLGQPSKARGQSCPACRLHALPPPAAQSA